MIKKLPKAKTVINYSKKYSKATLYLSINKTMIGTKKLSHLIFIQTFNNKN